MLPVLLIVPASGKIYTPGQITDLRVVAASYEDLTVNLTWTAVGSQLDMGTGVYR